MDFGSTTSGSYHASCASDADESKYLKRVQYLRWVRLGLSIILFAIAISIISCESVPYQHYRRTSAYEKIWLYLWPLNLDLRPTIALLSCGCVIAFLNLAYIIIALLPSPHAHIKRLNLAAKATAVCGFLAALVGFVFTIYLTGANPPAGFSNVETLHSWTCKWKAVHGPLTAKVDDTATSPPAHFARDCALTRASFILTGLVMGAEILMGVMAGVGVWVERTVAKRRVLDAAQLVKVDVAPKYPGT
ncbi:hypothetical protein BBP40_000432 [Aspergillus hancockii]|nr:hypothetical protein BBP40_000432 [Aspergillus hancockii]